MLIIDLTTLNGQQLQRLLEAGRRDDDREFVAEITAEIRRRERGADPAPPPHDAWPDEPRITEAHIARALELEQAPAEPRGWTRARDPEPRRPAPPEPVGASGYAATTLSRTWSGALPRIAARRDAPTAPALRPGSLAGLLAALLTALAVGAGVGWLSAGPAAHLPLWLPWR